MTEYDEGFWNGYNDAIIYGTRVVEHPGKAHEYVEGYNDGYVEGRKEYGL